MLSRIGVDFSLKKIAAILLMIITSINILGCTGNKVSSFKINESVDLLASKNEDTLAGATENDIEAVVSKTFKDSSNNKEKTKATKGFLDTINKVSKYFDDGYECDDPCAFGNVDDKFSLRFVRAAKSDLDNTNRYLNMFFGKLIFNTEKDYEYIEKIYRIVLCDEEDLGKVQIDSNVEKIIKDINPDVNIKDIQSAIDKNIQSISNEIAASGKEEIIYNKDGKKCTVIAYKLSYKPILVLIDFSEDEDL